MRRAAVVAVLVFGIVVTTVPAAPADPPPLESRTYLADVSLGRRVDQNLVLTVLARFTDVGGRPPARAADVDLAVYSCGNLLRRESARVDSSSDGIGVFLSPDGEPDYDENAVNRRVGPSVRVVAEITQAGFDAYTVAHTDEVTDVVRPTCQEINHPLRPRWSTKHRTRTVVGDRISVTPTTAPGAQVSYAWKLRNRYGRLFGATIGTGQSLRLQQRWVGRRPGVIVTVRKPRYQAQRRELVFAPVRTR